MLSPKSIEKNLSLTLPASGSSLAFSWNTSISASVITWHFLHVSGSEFPSSYEDTSHIVSGPSLTTSS